MFSAQALLEHGAKVVAQPLMIKQELAARWHPEASVGAQAATGNEIMDVRMKNERARPGVEHAEHAQLGAGDDGGWDGRARRGFCGSTALGSRSRYVFMVFAFRFSVVWGVSSTTCGSAARSSGRNPPSLRRADAAFAFIKSHTD